MKYFLSYLTIAVLLSACCKDHSDIIPGQDFIPDDILKAIEDNGQIIHKGYNPPALQGKYLMSPVVLVNSNFDDPFLPGHRFVDAIIEFSEYNPNKLTLKVAVEEIGVSKGDGYGSFISGYDNYFTVYVKVNNKDTKGHEVLTANVYSGTIEADGIYHLQLSIFVIDNNGDPNNEYVENGQGRLIIDQDSISEKI